MKRSFAEFCVFSIAFVFLFASIVLAVSLDNLTFTLIASAIYIVGFVQFIFTEKNYPFTDLLFWPLSKIYYNLFSTD